MLAEKLFLQDVPEGTMTEENLMSNLSITADQWTVLAAICGSAQRRLTSRELSKASKLTNAVGIADSLVDLGLLDHDSSSDRYTPTIKGWTAYNR